MSPWQLSNNLLDKLLVRVSLGECAHVGEVSTRESLHIWKLAAQIVRQSADHFGTPALLLLAFQNRLANLPIEAYKPAVHTQRSSDTRRSDALL
jgi:hypothetical protein